jgi:hypothetical protein
MLSEPFHFLLDASAGFYAGFKDTPSAKVLPDASVTAFGVIAVRGVHNVRFGDIAENGDWG